MKHFYSEVDGVTLTFGDAVEEDYGVKVPVYFERDDGKGDFDFAEGFMPPFYFSRSRGFSEFELEQLKRFLRNNAPLIMDVARGFERL